MGFGTPIGRVRGLGAAKEGTHHWWRQRLTAGGNIALMAWLLLSLARLPGYDYGTVHGWLGSPWVAVPMAALIANVFYHFRLGLQVVIEDYQHNETRIVLMVLLNAYTLVLMALGIFSVLKVAFTGAPH
jgi:succinate dehydrogenase / fumarate reductase membrane anchor subunit